MGWDGAMTPQTNDCSQGEAWKMSERVGFRMTGTCKNVEKKSMFKFPSANCTRSVNEKTIL